MGYVYQPKLKSGGRSSIWWAKWYVDGRPMRESTGTEKKREAEAFLKDRVGRIIPWLFAYLSGKKRLGERRREFRMAWTAACAVAGVPGMLRHDFRRTAVRNMERSGVARSVARKLTGHKTEAVFRRYAIVSDADLHEAALRLTNGHVSGTFKVSAVDARPLRG